MPDLIRIATRKSPLALWQAQAVACELKAHHADIEVELVRLSTQGDRMLDSLLASIGGKGLFVKELEQGLFDQHADIAVHSIKDVPVSLPAGLCLPVILAREDPRDVFVANGFSRFADLPSQARIGTASLRRQCQIKARFPALQVLPIRGNVNTRLARLDRGEFEALILAAAGLKRLGLEDRISSYLSEDESLPAIGQGAIGIECREADEWVLELILPLNNVNTHTCIRAERALNTYLKGGCQAPVAGFARLIDGVVHLRGLIGDPDGRTILYGSAQGAPEDAERIGCEVAEQLLTQGAGRILHMLGITMA